MINKVLKVKLISGIICIAIGIVAILYNIFNSKIMSDELSSYVTGFAFGVMSVGVVVLYKGIKALTNPKEAEKIVNIENDERIKGISYKSMSISLKLTMLLEACVSIYFAFTNNLDDSVLIGFILWAQIIIYAISFFIISKKAPKNRQ